MPRQLESEIGTLKAVGPAAHPQESKYERLIAKAKQVPPAQTIVVHPCDESSLRGPVEAANLGIIKPILVGPAAKISTVAKEHMIESHMAQSGRTISKIRNGIQWDCATKWDKINI